MSGLTTSLNLPDLHRHNSRSSFAGSVACWLRLVNPPTITHDALQIVRETTGCENIRKASTEVGVGGRGRSSYWPKVHRLRADEGGEVGVLAGTRGIRPALASSFAAIADGDLGGALSHPRRRRRWRRHAWQLGNGAARLHAADGGAPAIQFERTGDIHRHGISRVRPGVVLVRAILKFPRKPCHRKDWSWRHKAGATRSAAWPSRCISNLPTGGRTPGRIFRRLENLGQIAGLLSSAKIPSGTAWAWARKQKARGRLLPLATCP